MADPITFTTFAQLMGLPTWAFYTVLIWTLFWKALALWKSARLNQPVWFIFMMVLNTVGILEILYLFLFSELTSKKESPISKQIISKQKPRRR